ncbi:hypothetical protein [Roseateles violae]|uniref:DUF5666 domain-containing protein n=1 Tax=Roseateles violae TaxID=3058042 RepID=A0ABT8DQ44_9BURK|nr:hypothetical protein [Pelomonas sp. PFR6]MDN3919155.1 hypothetical protein [Pelomonas sp. PFR6]
MRSLLIASACVAALSLPHAAFSQGAAVGAASVSADGVRARGGEIAVSAKIIELDKANRSAVLQGPRGELFSLDVPADVKNFDQVQVGDELTIRYVVALATKIEPAGSNNGIRERVESQTASKAAAGGMPGVGAGRTIEALGVIDKLDRKTRMVTLRGAKRSVTLAVPEDIDLTKLKTGMQVRAVFAEAALLNVERKAAAAK